MASVSDGPTERAGVLVTAVERLLPRLSHVRQIGERWIGRCPAHEDHSPSLSIRRTRDRVLIRCWAGCRATDIVAAIGLTLNDLFDGERRQHTKPDPVAQRKRRAIAGLEIWRQSEIQRIAEDLRTRDIIIQQIAAAVHARTLTENEALTSLEHEYRGYADFEYRFERLLRNEDTLQLWRESRHA
jgi:hypothetical protein